MTDIGFVELVLVAVVTLVFVGPEDLPEVIRYLGKMYGQFQRMAAELRRSFTLEADRMDEERRLRDLIRRRKEAEAERRAHDEAHGTRAQPDQVDQAARAARAAQAAAAQEAAPPSGEAPAAPVEPEDVLPPGFTPEQWAELPDHIKEIVRRRRSA